MTRIAADMDGVLTDLIGYTATQAIEAGLKFDWSSITAPDFMSDPSFPKDVHKFVRHLWSLKQTWLSLPPLPTVGVLKEYLAQAPHTEFVVMTSPWSVNRTLGMCVDAKREWLDSQGLHPQAIMFTARSLTKRVEHPMKQVIQADFYYEDHPDIAMNIAEAHPESTVVILKRPWNSSPAYIKQYKRFSGIVHHDDGAANLDVTSLAKRMGREGQR